MQKTDIHGSDKVVLIMSKDNLESIKDMARFYRRIQINDFNPEEFDYTLDDVNMLVNELEGA